MSRRLRFIFGLRDLEVDTYLTVLVLSRDDDFIFPLRDTSEQIPDGHPIGIAWVVVGTDEPVLLHVDAELYSLVQEVLDAHIIGLRDGDTVSAI